MKEIIRKSVDSAQRAQRNYDLTKQIPKEDIDTLIYAAANSPSKQNETHYSLHVYTDHSIIRQIYDTTQKFTLGIKQAIEREDGEEWLYKNRSVKNSQILSNALFVYVDDDGDARNTENLKAQNGDLEGTIVTERQKNYSIGISIGELILSANLLGYKTGLCSAFSEPEIKDIIGTTKTPKMLVGVGYDNPNIDRRMHAETLNRDIPVERRTGGINEKWKFPSFEKNIKIFLNNKLID